jgi:hypothetical protein
MTRLLSLLEAAQQYATFIVMDPSTDNEGWMRLEEVVQDIEAMLNRIRRALKSGFFKELLQHHDIDGKHIQTYLLADKRYVAFVNPQGHLYEGKTRTEALQNLMKADPFLQSGPIPSLTAVRRAATVRR